MSGAGSHPAPTNAAPAALRPNGLYAAVRRSERARPCSGPAAASSSGSALLFAPICSTMTTGTGKEAGRSAAILQSADAAERSANHHEFTVRVGVRFSINSWPRNQFDVVGRRKSFRSSCLAAFNTRFRSGLKFRPPRFISKFSIDIAERNGVDLRRELRSEEFFRERASARGLLSLKTPDSRSSASLVFVTCDDHRLAFGRARAGAARRARAIEGFFTAIEA